MTKPAPNLIKVSLFIFAIISFFYVFGNLSDSTLVMVISTTLVIPSLAFFYLLKSERILIYKLILMLSCLGSVLIFSNIFLYKISGIICFWGMILLLGYHILKELKEPLKIQLKNKNKKILLTIHLGYLVGIIYYLSGMLGSFIYPIIFYGAFLIGTSFLSLLLYIEQKSTSHLLLLIGVIMLVFSGTILAILLFLKNLNVFQDSMRLIFYIGSEFFICLYFISPKE